MEFALIYGSVRDQRQGIHAANFVKKQVVGRGHQVVFIDAKELKLPLLNKRYMDYPKGQAPEFLERLAEIFRRVDGFLMISGEYNHGLQPGLKNLLDHFYATEYGYRPSGIVSYSGGAFGGVRSSIQLRATVSEIGMPSIPMIFSIPKVQDAFDQNHDAKDPTHLKKFLQYLDQFEWYARAFAAERLKGIPS